MQKLQKKRTNKQYKQTRIKGEKMEVIMITSVCVCVCVCVT